MKLESLKKGVREGRYILHHSAVARGYCPVYNHNAIEPYNGRYGSGYIVHEASRRPSIQWGYRSDSYHRIFYYIRVNNI